MTKFAVSIGLVVCLSSCPLAADDWPQFRGGTGDGISNESHLPVQWSAEKGIRWRIGETGRANSSPAITADRIDLTSVDEAQRLWVMSYDRATGKLLRKTEVGTGELSARGEAKLYAHRHNAATPSPAADERNIYAFFGSGLLACVEASTGSIVWKRDLVREYGPYDITFGMGSSPRLWEDRLYVACMTKGPSYVVALDKQTGKEVWKKDRRFPADDDGPDSYSSPIIRKNGERTELVISGCDCINAYDAQSGNPLWLYGGLKVKSEFGRVIASPAASGKSIIATTANPGGSLGRVVALRPGDDSAKKKLPVQWTYSKSTPDSSTPICYQDCVYLCSDQGIATCLDLKTGKLHWQQRLAQGPYHTSLVAGDGKVYFLSTDGTCTVVEAGKKFKVLAENKLSGTFYATPAISNGVLYLRSYESLYAIGSD